MPQIGQENENDGPNFILLGQLKVKPGVHNGPWFCRALVCLLCCPILVLNPVQYNQY